MRAAGRSRPGLVDPHTHLLFAGSREGELRPAPARRRLPRDPRGRRRHPLHGRGDARRHRPTTLLAHGRRWLDEMLGHGVTTIEAKSGYGLDLETEIRLRRGRLPARPRGPDRRRADVPRRPRRRRPSSGRGPTATEAYVRVGHRGAAARASPPTAGPASATCSARRACSPPTSRGGSSRRPRATGMAPRLHADELAPSGGAELAAELGAASADHLATPSDGRDRGAGRGRGRADEPVVATLLPATTWFLMKDHHAPARDVHRARACPVAIGTDFNPGTSPTASLPLAMTVACVELRHDAGRGAVARSRSTPPGRSASRTRSGRSSRARPPTSSIWRVPTTAQIPYWPGADLVRTVIKRGRVVLDRA